MKAKITYLWGEYDSYYVTNRSECKDATDRSIYDQLAKTGFKCMIMGKVCIERLP